jgi:methylenetetrahydrofolate dehydrogenase (NADP+)/methenyltetrahydrofolate cyclohydrolase
MIVDGKLLSEQILEQVAKQATSFARTPTLTAVTCAPNFETRKYLAMKKAKARSVGISLNVVELPADIRTTDFIDCINQVADHSDGIVVQLPLPEQLDRDKILNAVSVDKDPDGFHYGIHDKAVLSPVVAAIDEISHAYQVDWHRKNVVILGQGRLVGLPAVSYAKSKGAQVEIMTETNFSPTTLLTADIIISGVGKPNLITDSLVKEGVVIFDAGTSEDGGVLVGDCAPEIAQKAQLITPVPGGIGPITIACLLSNLMKLVRQ